MTENESCSWRHTIWTQELVSFALLWSAIQEEAICVFEWRWWRHHGLLVVLSRVLPWSLRRRDDGEYNFRVSSFCLSSSCSFSWAAANSVVRMILHCRIKQQQRKYHLHQYLILASGRSNGTQLNLFTWFCSSIIRGSFSKFSPT